VEGSSVHVDFTCAWQKNVYNHTLDGAISFGTSPNAHITPIKGHEGHTKGW